MSMELQIHVGDSRSFSLVFMWFCVSSVSPEALRLWLSSRYSPFYCSFLMRIQKTGEIWICYSLSSRLIVRTGTFAFVFSSVKWGKSSGHLPKSCCWTWATNAVNYERRWVKGNQYAKCCVVINLQARFFKEPSTRQLLLTSSSAPKGNAKIIKTFAGGLVLREI